MRVSELAAGTIQSKQSRECSKASLAKQGDVPLSQASLPGIPPSRRSRASLRLSSGL